MSHKKKSRRPQLDSVNRMKSVKSVETRYYEEREQLFEGMRHLDRRSFFKVAGAAMGAAMGAGLVTPHSFMNVKLARAGGGRAFRFAYISDSHLLDEHINDRFVRSLLRAVDDVNRLDPAPDFVFFGGDLAQLGSPTELELGAAILRELKPPLKMMVGEHDWYLDMGEKWRDLFGDPTYSWDHEGVHFVVLNSVIEEDFWTARGLTPEQRMLTVAGLDNQMQNPFTVGAEQRRWLARDLEGLSNDTPLVVFSHSPLYKLYKPWNFWTDDADDVQAILRRFEQVTVIHGHTHQMLTNRIDNIHFHGMLSTAWPWPYAPEGLPELTIQMARPDPFSVTDGCGNGEVQVNVDGLVDKVYGLWDRNPVTIESSYLASLGKRSAPKQPAKSSY